MGNHFSDADLWQRWQALFNAWIVDHSLLSCNYTNVVNAYNQPHRRYHNLNHLRQMLNCLDDLKSFTSEPNVIEPAVWYHDVVYDPRSNENEEKSAEWAQRDCGRLGLSPEIINEVRRLILLTKTHQAAPDDVAGQVLLDADLSILGASPEQYHAYAQAIREEYAWVEEDVYRRERAKVLQHFLHRDHVYFTSICRERLEGQARQNLLEELSRLCG